MITGDSAKQNKANLESEKAEILHGWWSTWNSCPNTWISIFFCL